MLIKYNSKIFKTYFLQFVLTFPHFREFSMTSK